MYSPTYAVFLRRLLTLLVLLFSVQRTVAQSPFHAGIDELVSSRGAFPFGVASGDPRQDRVVIWTKLMPQAMSASVEVVWQMALDSTFSQVVREGTAVTDSSRAFTVNVTVTGLASGTIYYYRFSALGGQSVFGRTRTASERPERVRFAVVSCVNLPAGHFNAFGLIARDNDLDAVIHLGDYIYEYGAREVTERVHIPSHEIISVKDYRSRYAQYRLDPDLMEAHRMHPFIVIWDDHENANNSYRDGADNHSAGEGSWEDRKAASKKAYFEWMPIDGPENQSIVRDFHFGDMADLFMIDGRLFRDPPVTDYNDTERYSTSRSKLGEEQTQWLVDGLVRSQARWRVIGNNVMFSPMDFGKFAKDRRWNMDQWDGYPANRDRIVDALESGGRRNAIVITGDIHTAWAMELSRDPHDSAIYDRRNGKGVIGAEFVTPSVSSKNLDELRGRLVAKVAASYTKARKRNPHLRYANLMDHGYMLLDLTAERAAAKWVYCRTLKKRSLATRPSKAWHLRHGDVRLHRGMD